MRTKVKEIKTGEVGKKYTVKGWVRTIRSSKTFSFLEVNDGSTLSNLQVIIDATLPKYEETIDKISTGAAVAITGQLVESPGKGQAVELKAEKVEVVGTCDAENYPLQKKRHSFEFLRTIAHLRPRTNTIGAVTRVRNALSFATHKFFNERGFLYINTPILTSSDCEGAGEMFRATTFDLNKLSFPALISDGLTPSLINIWIP